MASVYTNDLRLEEIGSGEQSGTWGDTTNTNLELIAEAFSFGTEAITTNADTHATTIADGATDAGRSMFLKYTGTLDSACTITIGPNTVSKLWFIENGTSGSQNIIIKQGSGATITIPAGQTKAIYSNGAGSGGAMVDAFATLNVVDLLVDDDLTVTDDVAIGGTLGVTGVVTANAGVVVDNFTLDGTTLALSSGDFTVDVAGDIILDADGGDVNFKDAGTEYLRVTNGASGPEIFSTSNDGDLFLKGVDGGATITALTLDMSDAGTAIFNHDIKLSDNGRIIFGAGADLAIYSDGTNGRIEAPNGDLVIDLAGDIILDVDGGDVRLKDGGTEFLQIFNNSTDAHIYNPVQDKDILFQGNDGGSTVTALTLDMSDAGSASFNHDIFLNQGGAKLRFGSSQQMVMFHDESNAEIDVSSGNLTLDVAGNIFLNADGSLIIFSDAAVEYGRVGNSSSDFAIQALVQDKDIQFKGNDNGSIITALTLDMSAAGEATFNSNVGIGAVPAHLLASGLYVAAAGYAGVSLKKGASNVGHAIDFNDENNALQYRIGTNFASGGERLIFNCAGTGETGIALKINPDRTVRFGVAGTGTGVFDINVGLASSGLVLDFIDEGGTRRFQVADDGDVANTGNSYGAISDVKLKENISDSASQWDDIKAIRVRKYSFKSDNLDAANQLGVIAQEVESAGMNGLVKSTQDEIIDENKFLEDGKTENSEYGTAIGMADTYTKSVKYSILYMKAVKALQEAMTRIETLESKVTALEG